MFCENLAISILLAVHFLSPGIILHFQLDMTLDVNIHPSAQVENPDHGIRKFIFKCVFYVNFEPVYKCWGLLSLAIKSIQVGISFFSIRLQRLG